MQLFSNSNRLASVLRAGTWLLLALLLAACLPSLTSQAPTPTAVTLALATMTPTPRPTNTPTPTPSPTATPTPRPTPTPTPQPASAESNQVSITMTEEEVNALAQDMASQQSDLPLSNVFVDLQEGQVTAGARTVLGFFTVDVAVTAGVEVSNCRPQPQIIQILVNGSQVGGFVRSQIDSLMAPYLEQFSQTDLGFCVETVEITDSQITVTGVRR